MIHSSLNCDSDVITCSVEGIFPWGQVSEALFGGLWQQKSMQVLFFHVTLFFSKIIDDSETLRPLLN